MDIDTKNLPISPILIIIFLIALGGASVVGIAYYGLKEKTGGSEIKQPDAGTQAPSEFYQETPAPAVDIEVVQPGEQMSNIPAEFTRTPTSGSTEIESVLPNNEVSAAYLKAYQEAQASKKAYKETSFQTSDNKPLVLYTFANSLQITIKSAVYQNLDQTKYRAVFCYREPDAVDRGFIFDFKRPTTIADYAKIYNEVEWGLKSWEQSIFTDLKNTFFPGSIFTAAPQFQEKEIAMSGGGQASFRYATIKDTQENNLYVGHAYYNEQVYIANSEECLKRILQTRTKAF